MSARDLLAALAEPKVRVVDCRFSLDLPDAGRRLYETGHIPGAVYASLDEDLSAPTGPGRHPLPPPDRFGERLAAMGIGDEHRVVSYDDAGGAIASRLWWMLRALGHEAAFVLDGGLQRWIAVDGPLTDKPTDHLPATLRLRSSYAGTAAYDEVASRLESRTLIDARAPERYRGEIEPIDPVAGHIPTAINIPYADNLDPDGRFSEADVIRSRYRAAGIARAKNTVVYCGSGVTACHDILAMEVAGLGTATLYPGSWSDWSARMAET
jgi:thiosulfate/3-mercaptopyruvate sulfurtransferase